MAGEAGSSLAKALGVLDSVARLASDATPATVSEIVSLTGLDKAQVSRMLSVFVDHGYVERIGQRKGYRLGWNSYLLGRQAQITTVAESVRVEVESAGAVLEESTYYSILSGLHGITLVSYEPDRRLYVRSWDGKPFTLVGSAVGCALLIGHSTAELDAQYDSELRLADGGELDWDRPTFHEMVAKAREDGYCRVEDEHASSISTVAVAVPAPSAPSSAPHGVLSVTVPDARFDGVDERALARLIECRDRISAGFGSLAGK